ncbi:hypothetical protein [Paenibacillus borealis]|uniref:DUF1877 family protein n=1 Tax=Paenibacillus borealis TaxID=160799 RepID=A0A089L8N1_PAEBO|nr:hypothetical protein [Paenibacillus borealis]AIQ57841.1 hypothetical protein PBOR_13550 [Paenibacillus borealis]
MSLIVSIIKKNNIIVDTELLEAQVPEPHNNLFGFESYREKLWGMDTINELGCELIFSLKGTNIYAFDEDLDKLRSEFLILLDNLDVIQLHIGDYRDFIEFAAGNALEMIKIALTEKDKVGIAIW